MKFNLTVIAATVMFHAACLTPIAPVSVAATDIELAATSTAATTKSSIPAQKFLRGDRRAKELQAPDEQRSLGLGEFKLQHLGFKCSISPSLPWGSGVSLQMKLDAKNDGQAPYYWSTEYSGGEYGEKSISSGSGYDDSLYWVGLDIDTTSVAATVTATYVDNSSNSLGRISADTRNFDWAGYKYHICIRDETLDAIMGACWVQLAEDAEIDMHNMGTPSRASEGCCVPGMPGNDC